LGEEKKKKKRSRSLQLLLQGREEEGVGKRGEGGNLRKGYSLFSSFFLSRGRGSLGGRGKRKKKGVVYKLQITPLFSGRKGGKGKEKGGGKGIRLDRALFISLICIQGEKKKKNQERKKEKVKKNAGLSVLPLGLSGKEKENTREKEKERRRRDWEPLSLRFSGPPTAGARDRKGRGGKKKRHTPFSPPFYPQKRGEPKRGGRGRRRREGGENRKERRRLSHNSIHLLPAGGLVKGKKKTQKKGKGKGEGER